MFAVHRIIRASSLIAFGFLFLVGCEKRATVSGKVLENGQPIAGAELRWVGTSDKAVFASGASDQKGVYIIDAGGKRDIPVGRYQVTVGWWRTHDGRALPQGEEGAALKGKRGAAVLLSATLNVEVTSRTMSLDLYICV